jgi:hypothetical protein
LAQFFSAALVRHNSLFRQDYVTGRGTTLQYYRLYMMAEPGGRFVGFEEIEAGDDVEAVRLAEAHPGTKARELWCGKRKVRTFPARDGDARK